jgi:hypothetical protein
LDDAQLLVLLPERDKGEDTGHHGGGRERGDAGTREPVSY